MEDDQIEDHSDNDLLEIEVVDDTPEEDKGRARRPEGAEPEIPDDDEIAKYSEGVQKRIKKLRYEFHEERRAKEETARQLEQAANLAKHLMEEKKRMEEALRRGEQIMVENAKGKVDAELEVARKKFKEAYDAGDADALTEAQERLSELQVQKISAANYQPVYREEEPAQQQAPRYEPVVRPPTDPKAVEWAKKNSWFGRDQLMTDYAKHIHDRVVVFDRIDPRTDQYWQTLDTEMRKRFPEMFDEPEESQEPSVSRQKSPTVVAPASRGNAPKPRTQVKLTSSEVALAKRLGITVEQYAAEKMRSRSNG